MHTNPFGCDFFFYFYQTYIFTLFTSAQKNIYKKYKKYGAGASTPQKNGIRKIRKFLKVSRWIEAAATTTAAASSQQNDWIFFVYRDVYMMMCWGCTGKRQVSLYSLGAEVCVPHISMSNSRRCTKSCVVIVAAVIFRPFIRNDGMVFRGGSVSSQSCYIHVLVNIIYTRLYKYIDTKYICVSCKFVSDIA